MEKGDFFLHNQFLFSQDCIFFWRQQRLGPKTETKMKGVVGKSAHDWISKLLGHKRVFSPLKTVNGFV